MRSVSASDVPTKSQRTIRINNNKVERKYRQGSNADFERLRRTIPTLPQRQAGGSNGQPRPSKSAVLIAATSHIKNITQERDMLQSENDESKSARKGNSDRTRHR